jgi:hypothetical protein
MLLDEESAEERDSSHRPGTARRGTLDVPVQTPSLRTMMGFAALYPSYRKSKEL